MSKIVISSGHGKYVRGASGVLDEVDEARKVVDETADALRLLGDQVVVFHDDVSTTQNENLNRIVDFHNSQGPHDYDVSVHFNAYDGSANGTEVCYLTQEDLARHMSADIVEAGGFVDRGPKYRSDLFFLQHTIEKSILIETCFCDSSKDAQLYNVNFLAICDAIAGRLTSGKTPAKPPAPEHQPTPPVGATAPLLQVEGKVSYFGGPNDMGVSPSEGLAFIYSYEEAPWLFLPEQPQGTTGLARRLNPQRPYVACRWDYAVTPKEMLKKPYPALVEAPATGRQLLAWPSDWGPHQDTGRVADISPGLMSRLDIETDGIVKVTYPAPIQRYRR